MKLRNILLILSLLAIFSILTGGYLYYKVVKKAGLERIAKRIVWDTESRRNFFTHHIKTNLKAVKSIAMHSEIKQALAGTSQTALDDANRVLDHYTEAYDASVCYLMDHEGNTIASSNRKDPDSFVGKNYSFRSYFQEAIKGKPSVYMALGVTSGERGVYHSQAVYSDGRNTVSGVVVMKASGATLEKEILRGYPPGEILFVTGPDGVIFMSSQDQYLFQVLEEVSDEKMAGIIDSKQFGNTPLKWSGFKKTAQDRMVDRSGKSYIITRKKIEPLRDWQIVYLYSMDEILMDIAPDTDKVVMLAVLVVVSGLVIIVLYEMARTDIIKRRAAEKNLQKTKDTLNAILESTTDGILVRNEAGEIIFYNNQFQKMWQIPGKILRSKNDEKIFGVVLKQLVDPENFLTKVKALYKTTEENFDIIFFKDGRVFELYSQPLLEGENITGRVWSFRDVTQKKQAENQQKKLIQELQDALNEVRHLRGILPICSHCKKIRDDKGAWNQIEGYIQEHSDAQFSHGICPECSDELYGNEDWYIEMKNKEKK